MEGDRSRATVERATRLGRVRGIERLGVETYLGLRYAQPAERFKPAVLATQGWAETYHATAYRAIPVQPPVSTAVYGRDLGAPMSEDCLFLNIHTPQAPSAAPRPVIVFIHGGSFTSGGANFYDGTALAKGADAVAVSINYRLGVFAGFDPSWLGTAHDGGGQLWLGDQITALKWIRDNIADYGGDPNLVTIIGESAGAVSVAALCAAPQAQGLVHRAVACSTGYLLPERSNDVVGVVARMRRCSREQAIQFLMTASTQELADLQKRGKAASPQPVATTPLLPGTMEELIRARGANAVPLIAGYATHEGLVLDLMIRQAVKLPGFVISLVNHIISLAIAKHAARGSGKVRDYLRRLKKATGCFGFGKNFNDLVWTDGFRRGAVDYAEATVRAGGKAYVYAMDVPMRFAGTSIPSSHGIDVALTFDVWSDPEHTVPQFADHVQAPQLAQRWVKMLGHFARTGEPGDALGPWPAYDVTRRATQWVACDGCRTEDHLEALYRENVWR